jgi:hypothetical protein
MLNVLNLKVLRKLFLLTVLSVGLFFAASANKASAEATDCCEDCYDSYLRCAMYTCATNDRECVESFCLPIYYTCADACYPLICY